MGIASAFIDRVCADASMEVTLPAVRRSIADFVGGADQFDDITMLGFAYFGSEWTEGGGCRREQMGREYGNER